MVMDEQLLESYFEKMDTNSKGTTLALGAVAETLQKMNFRLAKQEEAEEQQKYDDDVEMEKQAGELSKQSLIKEISIAVVDILKTGNMELNADKFRSVSHGEIFEANGGDEDKQKDAKDTNDTSKVQQPIQAMLKQLQGQVTNLQKHFLKEHADLYQNDEAKEEVLGGEEEMVEMQEEPIVPPMEEEGSAEYPMEEDAFEDEDMIKMAKMVKSLSKQVASLKKGIGTASETKAKVMAESTLKQQGWNKETSRTPRLTGNNTMGLDDQPIRKSQDNADVADQLSTLSWNELTRMYQAKRSGNTDGLPREVIEN
jgi:hypothetical protein